MSVTCMYRRLGQQIHSSDAPPELGHRCEICFPREQFRSPIRRDTNVSRESQISLAVERVKSHGRWEGKSNQPSRAQCSNHRTTTDTSAINLLDSVSSRSCETMITPIFPVLHGCLLALVLSSPSAGLESPLSFFFLFFFFLTPSSSNPPPPSHFPSIHCNPHPLSARREESHHGAYPSVRDYRIIAPTAGQNILESTSPSRRNGGGPTLSIQFTRCQTEPLGKCPSSSGLHHLASLLSTKFLPLVPTNLNSFPASVGISERTQTWYYPGLVQLSCLHSCSLGRTDRSRQV
ncbi:hypothetical protein ASPFODRAFT_665978 [Aspergillus luchuensis CBS 106.47]|uniref:Uncharacterized protein n=1 Tax=Aspergillus luchuensis (strain CBS 106.47) TaxID=1137211 RepID=A0A1M3TF90_ASPLC|nr:hypothetical protein ASPFODRAFT_665978 [Aspergillus luchuensis CBS 106.47]